MKDEFKEEAGQLFQDIWLAYAGHVISFGEAESMSERVVACIR